VIERNQEKRSESTEIGQHRRRSDGYHPPPDFPASAFYLRQSNGEELEHNRQGNIKLWDMTSLIKPSNQRKITHESNVQSA
jgi:hypothetical protein